MVFNKGFIGNGKYKSSINGERYRPYDIWHSILERCYHPNTLKKYPTYEQCEICEEWLDFQNFAQWYETN